jgi:hypothetical protein
MTCIISMAPMNALGLWNVPRLSLFSKLVEFSQKEKLKIKNLKMSCFWKVSITKSEGGGGGFKLL